MYLKNPKGRIVEVTDERGEYLLNTNPVLLREDGKPKTDLDGRTYPLIKGEHEKGYTTPSPSEVKAYEAEQQASRDQIEEEQNLRMAGAQAMIASTLLSQRANVVAKPKKAEKKAKAQDVDDGADVDLEIQARDAEGDAKKYDALSDEAKEMYIALFGDAPEGAK